MLSRDVLVDLVSEIPWNFVERSEGKQIHHLCVLGSDYGHVKLFFVHDYYLQRISNFLYRLQFADTRQMDRMTLPTFPVRNV